MPYIQINGKNFEALNFNDQRTSAILKQALRIEEDQKDRFQKFKAQKISPAVCQMNKIKLNFRERIEKMNTKLEKINKLKKMTQTKMMFEKFASKSQVSANKENKDSTGQWLTKADKLFDLLTENNKKQFLEKIEEKVKKYDTEKYAMV